MHAFIFGWGEIFSAGGFSAGKFSMGNEVSRE